MTDQRSQASSDAHGGPGGSGQPPGQRPGQPGGERPAGMTLGRVRGVPILVSPFALVFAVLVAYLMSDSIRDRLPDASDGQVLGLAAAISVGFLASLLAHELGHALVALRLGHTVRTVTLHGFAGFTEFEPEPRSAGRMFLITFSGPAVNGILAGACELGLLAVSGDSHLGVVLRDLGLVNLTLFVFNLAPGLPLDGGRIVVAAVWAATGDQLRGLRAGAYGGFVVAGALVVWGSMVGGEGIGLFYTYALAGFLAFAAYQSLRAAQLRGRLPGLSAGRLVRRTLPVEGAVPLAEALRRAQEVGATAVAVIGRDGAPQKIMNGSAVDALPEHRRPWMSVDEVSREIGPGMVFDADLEGEDLLAAVQRVPASEYLVTQGGRPVGVLAMVDLVARLDPAAAARMVAHR
ncbi:site-2 protease family protein [Frankia sp. AgPm24]|uniref:site-2 protease family protein n=1 Tax=Frankia sp. AgPm24 TaxID=631128 RepID=UPI00200E5FED|nr:site-2 protease family protein [Frankia sp. AgPm24]MCK9925182.1 site-2 protease family protein [Frankia sp. AgPm24]